MTGVCPELQAIVKVRPMILRQVIDRLLICPKNANVPIEVKSSTIQS